MLSRKYVVPTELKNKLAYFYATDISFLTEFFKLDSFNWNLSIYIFKIRISDCLTYHQFYAVFRPPQKVDIGRKLSELRFGNN